MEFKTNFQLSRELRIPLNRRSSMTLMTLYATPFKLLLVEDKPLVMRIHKEMLEEIGHTPDTAVNGQEALQMAQLNQYSLILMNLGLPGGISGIDATLQIRQTEQGKATPIVAVTASPLEMVEEKCLAAGMDKVLTFPIRIDTLRQLIHVYSIKYQGRNMRANKVAPHGFNSLKKLQTLPIIQKDASQEMLDKLAKDLPEMRREIDEAYYREDMDTFVWIVNKIYGGLCFTGTPQLREAFSALETSIINGDIHQISELYHAALATLDAFEAVYQRNLSFH